jgi:hypothetical protein
VGSGSSFEGGHKRIDVSYLVNHEDGEWIVQAPMSSHATRKRFRISVLFYDIVMSKRDVQVFRAVAQYTRVCVCGLVVLVGCVHQHNQPTHKLW